MKHVRVSGKSVQWTDLSAERGELKRAAGELVEPKLKAKRCRQGTACRAFPEYVTCTKLPYFNPKNIAPRV